MSTLVQGALGRADVADVAVTVDVSNKPQHMPTNKKKYIILAGVVVVAIALALGLGLGLGLSSSSSGLSSSSSTTSDREQPSTATVKVKLSDLQPGAGAAARRRLNYPYGDASTAGATLPVKNIDSFKLSVLQVVLCEREPEATADSGADVLMGIGVSNGATSLQSKVPGYSGSSRFEDFGCQKICGEAPLTDKIAAGWFGTADVQDAPDTAEVISSYADSLAWTDLKNPSDLDSFGESCTAAAFPVGTFRWGWVIYAPIGKIKASIQLSENQTLYTKPGAMDGSMGAHWGVPPSTGALSPEAFTTGPAEESLFWVYGARGQQNFFSYRLSEPVTTVAGETYTLSLAFDLEGTVNAYAGVVQPTTPNNCYPDHPFKLVGPFSAWKISDSACCTAPATPAYDVPREALGQCSNWNIYTLMDREFNAFDVGYIQLSPILTAEQNTIWRQKYSMVIPAAAANRALHPIVYNSSSIVEKSSSREFDPVYSSGLDCTLALQLLYITDSDSILPQAGDQPLAASLGLTNCFYRDRGSEMTADALTPRQVRTDATDGSIKIYGGRFPWLPLLRGFTPLWTAGETGGADLTCVEYWECYSCAMSVSAVTEALTHAVNGFNFYDSCHSVCFPENCGECEPVLSNAALLELVNDGTTSYQSTPRPDARCEEYLLPDLQYTLNDVAIVQSLTMTRQATDPSPPPPSSPPLPPVNASYSYDYPYS